ncbi:SURF1 family protein [Oxalobacteraceae bacterium A2-2]
MMAGPQGQAERRSAASRFFLALCASLLFAGFFSLGTWQVKRLHWKLALIERVEQRVHAPVADAPGPAQWPAITADGDEYRHVRVTGAYLEALSARVQATTDLGAGFWVMTPLCGTDGNVVLVNRGFITEAAAARAPLPAPAPGADGGCRPHEAREGQDVTVTGLLRLSEPGGGYLRANDPAADRWHSRDVQAIAATRGVPQVAPYFIDADADANRSKGSKSEADAGRPVGGLTVISFHNNHLVYAVTWYALAAMVVGAFIWVLRSGRKARLD